MSCNVRQGTRGEMSFDAGPQAGKKCHRHFVRKWKSSLGKLVQRPPPSSLFADMSNGEHTPTSGLQPGPSRPSLTRSFSSTSSTSGRHSARPSAADILEKRRQQLEILLDLRDKELGIPDRERSNPWITLPPVVQPPVSPSLSDNGDDDLSYISWPLISSRQISQEKTQAHAEQHQQRLCCDRDANRNTRKLHKGDFYFPQAFDHVSHHELLLPGQHDQAVSSSHTLRTSIMCTSIRQDTPARRIAPRTSPLCHGRRASKDPITTFCFFPGPSSASCC